MSMSGEIALIRADAGAEMGVGHVMRCLALAQAWKKAGGRSIFGLAAGWEIEDRILSEGADVARIEAEPGSGEDAAQTVQLAASSDAAWLIVDGYQFSSEFFQKLRNAHARVLLIDERAPWQPCDCDVLVNPDRGSLQTYPRFGERTRFLLGPQYALLRQEFLGFQCELPRADSIARRVLVTFGGGDSDNVTVQVVRALLKLRDLELEVTVVAGPNYQHWSSLEAAAEEAGQQMRLLRNVKNMPELMSETDLAITAGGGTCYELAFMRVPMFIITIAGNQESFVKSLALDGAAFDAGWFSALSESDLQGTLRHVVCDSELRRNMVERAAQIVDGKGAERVVDVMCAIQAAEALRTLQSSSE